MPATPHYTQPPYGPIRAGDTVRALHAPRGEDHEGTEWIVERNPLGTVASIDEHGQVHVVFSVDPERCVVQVYSEDDRDLFAIELVDRATRTVVNRHARHASNE